MHVTAKLYKIFKIFNDVIFQKIMKFWYNKGVSGLRLDATLAFIEDPLLRDEPLLNTNIEKDEYKWIDFNHIYTLRYWENFKVVRELRLFNDKINKKKGGAER